MTRSDVQKILATIEMMFSSFKVDDPTAMVDIWHSFLEPYEYVDISSAIGEYVKTSNSTYAPSISQLIGIVNKNKKVPMHLSLIQDSDAWALVRIALQNSTYHASEEFEKLPSMVKKAVGSANQLYAWACDDNYNESAISSTFKRSYREICKKELEYSELTDQQKKCVDYAKQQLLDGAEFSDIDFNHNTTLIEEVQNF